MSGTKDGGRKTAVTNKEKYGRDYYRIIGSAGGKNGVTGGFYKRIPCSCSEVLGPHQKQQCAGKLGGQISRRRPKEVLNG